MVLKKNTIVWHSEFGYYRFIYRSERSFRLKEDAEVLKTMESWFNAGEYTPMLINYKGKKITIWIKGEYSNVR